MKSAAYAQDSKEEGLRIIEWVNFAPFPLFGKEGPGEIL